MVGVPVVTGVFTSLGDLSAKLVIIRLDHLHFLREDARRWLSDRHRIYASLLAPAEGIHDRLQSKWRADRAGAWTAASDVTYGVQNKDLQKNKP